MQKRYVPSPRDDGLFLRPCPYTPDEIDDLLYVQDGLTDDVLDQYDRRAPGRLEARITRLQRRLRGPRAA